ncbi:MAG: energy transducer TonB [Terriglobia bacterium]
MLNQPLWLRDLAAYCFQVAIKTLRTWKFKPAERDGKPVPVRILVETTFRIHNGGRPNTSS